MIANVRVEGVGVWSRVDDSRMRKTILIIEGQGRGVLKDKGEGKIPKEEEKEKNYVFFYERNGERREC